MKSTFAILSAASAATALLNLEVNLPLGISADLDLLGPKSDPCDECTNVWHPPHDGIIIDDCDNTDDQDWHWVHPCPEPIVPSFTWATLTATRTNTVTQCDACAEPTTVTFEEETTVCPVPVETVSASVSVLTSASIVTSASVVTSTSVVTSASIVTRTFVVTSASVVTSEPVHSSVSSTWMATPSSTFTSICNTNTVPVPPVVNTPVVPGTPARPAVHTPTWPGHSTIYGHNATNPVVTPPIVTAPPAAGAAQNTVGFVLVAALAFALW